MAIVLDWMVRDRWKTFESWCTVVLIPPRCVTNRRLEGMASLDRVYPCAPPQPIVSVSLAFTPIHSLPAQVYCRSAKLPETNAAVVVVRVPVKPLKVRLRRLLASHCMYSLSNSHKFTQ